MRRLLLVVALVVVGGGLLGWQVQKDSGYLLITYGNYTIDMSLWVALSLLLLAGIFWWGLKLLWRWVNAPGKGLKHWITGGQDRVRLQTAKGMMEYAEGRWEQSWRTLKKSIKRSDTPLVNCLTAANAAYEAGDLREARDLLVRADTLATSGSYLAVELLRAKLYQREGAHQEALAILARLHDEQPGHLEILRLLLQIYQDVKDWQQLEKLLPACRNLRVLPAKELLELEVQVYIQVMLELVVDARGGSAALVQLWEGIPSDVCMDRRLVEVYANCLHQAGDSSRAEEVLRKELGMEWDGALVLLYGLVEGEDTARQLMVAESWLIDHKKDANLLLTLGRLCQRSKLWGKARDYLESSLSIKARPEVYAELARLMAQLEEPEKSAYYYQQGLRLSAGATAVFSELLSHSR